MTARGHEHRRVAFAGRVHVQRVRAGGRGREIDLVTPAGSRSVAVPIVFPIASLIVAEAVPAGVWAYVASPPA